MAHFLIQQRIHYWETYSIAFQSLLVGRHVHKPSLLCASLPTVRELEILPKSPVQFNFSVTCCGVGVHQRKRESRASHHGTLEKERYMPSMCPHLFQSWLCFVEKGKEHSESTPCSV